MITNLKLKKYIEEVREITSKDLVLYSGKGQLLSSSKDAKGSFDDAVKVFITNDDDYLLINGNLMVKVLVDDELEYVIVIPEADDSLIVAGRMAACQLRNLVLAESDKYDRNSFMQNVLLGNILLGDMSSRAKKLHIENRDRVVFLIDSGYHSNDIAVELVKNLSDTKSLDFVFAIDDSNMVLIKDVDDIAEDQRASVLETIAKSLVDNLSMEAMIKVRVSYSNPTGVLGGIANAYNEAKMALAIGKIFYADKDTVHYGKLGIGRLIYQLPMTLCEMFIKEVFGDTVPDILEDEEAMSTINKFFENNLNISETARQLYVHRNTLVYRLERIEKAIGLDIRFFDDAMTFKIAVMVLAHIKDQSKDR